MKSVAAKALLRRGGVVSVQVLNEFVSVTRRKLRLDWKEVRRLLASVEVFCGPPRTLTTETHVRALAIAERYDLHIYDANIVAAALLAGCETLYSEDMQDGQRIDSLTIRNPFKAGA